MKKLNNEQQLAFEKAKIIIDQPVSDNILDNMFLILGKGGTGKTYTAEFIIDYIENKHPYSNISVVAPTWNAVTELEFQNASLQASTFASFVATTNTIDYETGNELFVLKSFEEIEKMVKYESKPGFLDCDFFIGDEVSMLGGNNEEPYLYRNETYISDDSFKTLIYRLKQREELLGTKVRKFILMGDYCQLPPIGTHKDHDAKIIEYLMSKPNQHAILTTNMRTGFTDINELLNSYRFNIDLANKNITKNIDSNSILRNVNSFDNRINSKNITYISDENELIQKYVEIFKNDTNNIRNIVIGNYNNAKHKKTVELTNKIRKGLFGENPKFIEDGEYLMCTNNYEFEHNRDTYTIHNNHRLFLDEPKEENKKFVLKYFFYDRKIGRRKTISTSIKLKGISATLRTIVKEKETKEDVVVRTNVFIPYAKSYNEIDIGQHDYKPTIKGYLVNEKEFPYYVIKNFKDEFIKIEYAYVVNSHKVQGSTYDYVILDEQNILNASHLSNKECNQSLYTILSRVKKKLFIYNENNPSTDTLIEFDLNEYISKRKDITNGLYDILKQDSQKYYETNMFTKEDFKRKIGRELNEKEKLELNDYPKPIIETYKLIFNIKCFIDKNKYTIKENNKIINVEYKQEKVFVNFNNEKYFIDILEKLDIDLYKKIVRIINKFLKNNHSFIIDKLNKIYDKSDNITLENDTYKINYINKEFYMTNDKYLRYNNFDNIKFFNYLINI